MNGDSHCKLGDLFGAPAGAQLDCFASLAMTLKLKTTFRENNHHGA